MTHVRSRFTVRDPIIPLFVISQDFFFCDDDPQGSTRPTSCGIARPNIPTIPYIREQESRSPWRSSDVSLFDFLDTLECYRSLRGRIFCHLVVEGFMSMCSEVMGKDGEVDLLTRFPPDPDVNFNVSYVCEHQLKPRVRYVGLLMQQLSQNLIHSLKDVNMNCC